MARKPAAFATRVIHWQRAHGRHGLPWQGTNDAYRVWLSEIMLQQTQVATVIPYYERFLARFPAVDDLARASEDEVLGLWSGLGYYARGRNLLAAARMVAERHGGRFPERFADLIELPGIGRSTAGAIASIAGGERRAILDANVRRVLSRHGGVVGDAALWELAAHRLPGRHMADYSQAMMDLGAQVCLARAPRCDACPVAADCVARIEDRIAELPGKRARAPRPRRQVAMLMVVDAGQVLLEKRPATGIWGGLWSLPEAAITEEPAQALRRGYGLIASRIERLEPFEHAFTHFTLDIQPWRLSVRAPAAGAARRRASWLALTELAGAALPAPVRKLLAAACAGTGAGPSAAPRRR